MRPPREPLRRPLYLARRPYRHRRLRDAARLLPVAGGVAFVLPAMWNPEGQGMRRLSGDIIYFFAVWAILISIAALFARGLARPDDGADDDMGGDAGADTGEGRGERSPPP